MLTYHFALKFMKFRVWWNKSIIMRWSILEVKIFLTHHEQEQQQHQQTQQGLVFCCAAVAALLDRCAVCVSTCGPLSVALREPLCTAEPIPRSLHPAGSSDTLQDILQKENMCVTMAQLTTIAWNQLSPE